MRKIYILMFLLLPAFAFAAAAPQAPGTNAPGYGQNPELDQPPRLPTGAINLDSEWTEDGGARLYWNNVRVPQEVKTNNGQWQDPALIPPLKPFPNQGAKSGKAAVKKKPVAKKKAVKKVARKKARKSPELPPVMAEEPQRSGLSPRELEERWVDARTDAPFIDPPRLQ